MPIQKSENMIADIRETARVVLAKPTKRRRGARESVAWKARKD